MVDDDLILIDEDDAPASPDAGDAMQTWRVLVVDDDQDVHRATELALRGLLVEGRPLSLVHAYSAGEARAAVEAVSDLAVILLDVVMETEDAGLQLVRHVRQDLQREAVRIILRTGQPGYAPELDTIRHYDINDYKTKSELTRVRLFTSLTTAVRSYRQMRAHEEIRRGFEMVIQASTELTKMHGMQMFAQGVVSQLCALLNVEPAGLICAQDGLHAEDEPARVIAAAGRFSHLIHRPLDELELPTVQEALANCLAQRGSSFEPHMLLYFSMENGRGLAAYVDVKRALNDIDRQLLQVFCASMAVGFENVLLYDRLVDQAYVDPLLRIPNLNRLLEMLDARLMERADSTLALIDIDDFSALNDTLGHEFGDAVLQAVAHRLSQGLPRSHLTRLGPDIFGVLGPSDEVAVGHLQQVLHDAVQIHGQHVRVSATMGLVPLADRIDAGVAVLKDAHVALKQAKLRQRGSAVYFSAAMGQDARERMRLLSGLRHAFDAQHMFLVYQPKVSLHDGRPQGVEALLRWRMSDGQLVPPDRFIPLAEQSGLMGALGTFVLRSACQQLARLRAAGEHELVMAINVSQAQLREPDFVATVQHALDDAKVPASQVELEITESMAADDLAVIRPLLDAVRALGVSVAIDDFGTGFSSLSVLRHLPAQRLKIDRSFINELDHDDSIARMVISLGHSLGMRITAEGVETESQRQALCELGCEEGQGWLFARPLDEAALLAWLAERRPPV